MDAFFEIPETTGTYWYWCEKRSQFRVCDVVEHNGEVRVRFTDGSFQRFCGDKSYFVGPIQPPVVCPDGTISS